MPYLRTKIAVNCLFAACFYLPAAAYATKEDGVRGTRYCEVIISKTKLNFAVYSTIGLNDCPENLWKKLTVVDIKKDTGSFFTYLNGPRHFVIDGFKNTKLVSLEKKKFGHLDMREAGVVHLSLWDLVMGSRPYREHQVDRKTTWIYKENCPIYELIDPNGQVFVMQSYSLEKEPLTEERLGGLGTKLNLPTGWSYKTGVLKQDAYLKAIDNKAIVIQDDWLNTYQLATSDFLK